MENFLNWPQGRGTLGRESLVDMDYQMLVKHLPASIDDQSLRQIFSKFGDVLGMEVLPGAEGTNEAKIKWSGRTQAIEAFKALNGAPTDRGSVLEVTCPGSGVESSTVRPQAPSDNVYVRQMPASWMEQDLREMFSAYGTVQECRILHRGEDIRGAGALVRMNNVAAASQAILALNGYLPRSQIGDFSSMPLLVRYADSPEEKARKQARKDQLAGRQHRSLDIPVLHSHPDEVTLAPSFRHSSLPAAYQALSQNQIGPHLDLGMDGMSNSNGLFANGAQSDSHIETLLSNLGPATPNPLSGNEGISLPSHSLISGFNGFSPSKGLLHAPPPPSLSTCTSLYVKNLPPETDRLWLYERFAPHGSIMSVKVLQEENSSKCRGVGFVNMTDAQGALNAIQNINGMKVADKHLHVSLQVTRGRV